MTLWDDQADVREALAIESGLTGWEMDFIESIAERVRDGEELTEAQREVLRRILNERT